MSPPPSASHWGAWLLAQTQCVTRSGYKGFTWQALGGSCPSHAQFGAQPMSAVSEGSCSQGLTSLSLAMGCSSAYLHSQTRHLLGPISSNLSLGHLCPDHLLGERGGNHEDTFLHSDLVLGTFLLLGLPPTSSPPVLETAGTFCSGLAWQWDNPIHLSPCGCCSMGESSSAFFSSDKLLMLIGLRHQSTFLSPGFRLHHTWPSL